MPAEYSSFVRNWFVAADGEGDPNKLSVEDSMGEVLSNGEVNKIIKNAAGDFAAKAVSSPLLKPCLLYTSMSKSSCRPRTAVIPCTGAA